LQPAIVKQEWQGQLTPTPGSTVCRDGHVGTMQTHRSTPFNAPGSESGHVCPTQQRPCSITYSVIMHHLLCGPGLTQPTQALTQRAATPHTAAHTHTHQHNLTPAHTPPPQQDSLAWQSAVQQCAAPINLFATGWL